MHHTRILPPAALIILLVVSCSTESGPPTSGTPVELVDIGVGVGDDAALVGQDQQTEVDAKEMKRERDQGTSRNRDMSIANDADMSSSKEIKFVEFLQSDWEQETPCSGLVKPNSIESEFKYPPEAQAYHIGKSSRAELMESAQNNVYTFIHRVNFDANLRPDNRSIILHRNNDEDVHIYIHTTILPEDIDRTKGMLTVLLDYKQVDATYKFSQDRWDNQIFTKKSNGVRFPIDTQFSMMEVILPSELFKEERMYEIAIGQITSRYDGTDGGIFRKIHLFNKSYTQLSHPCFEEPLRKPANTIEYGLVREAVSADVLLFPTYYPAVNEIAFERLLPAEPGQKVQINLSLRSRLNAKDRTRPVFLKPLLDGKPLEDEWRVSLAPEGPGSFNIDARKTFEVTLPEEPGIYEVSVGVWHDPHLMAVDLEGNAQRGISTGNGGDTSNLLRFNVTSNDANATGQ